ncbi:MAG: ISL3 family transposase [Methylorubrum rhodinum]|uniref:ISL3 family transposase n=1 Tax=Methylorubrum rhodinum TaxID=29428 RepID=UPI003BAED041
MSDLLRLKNLEHVSEYEEDDKLIIKVRSKRSSPERQCCLLVNFVRNGTKLKQRYRDEPIRRQTVLLEIDRQRYKCKECGKPVYEGLPDIDLNHDMTKKLRVRIQKDAIEWPFSHAAEINGVDDKQVERIFKAHAKRVLASYVPKMPRVLGMDEIHIRKKARFVLGDIENRAMLDMQMSRKKLSMERYFEPMPGRMDVEVVCQDMWKDYAAITKKLFPNAVTVIDKYHVQRTSNYGMEVVRRLLQQDISTQARVKLKNKRGIFLGRWNDIQPYTRNQMLALFVEFPELRRAYDIKEGYYEIYDATSKAEANEKMEWWLASLPKEYERPFKQSRDALNNWRPYILNYWDHTYTNAYVEGLNKLIRKMNLQGVGYDLETLRAKALLKHGNIVYEISEGLTRAGRRLPTRKRINGLSLSTLEADLEAGLF